MKTKTTIITTAPVSASTTPASTKKPITEFAPKGNLTPEMEAYIAEHGVDAELRNCKRYFDGTWRLIFTVDGEQYSAVLSEEVCYGPLMWKKMRIVVDTDTTPWTVVYPAPSTHPLTEKKVTFHKLPKERPAGF